MEFGKISIVGGAAMVFTLALSLLLGMPAPYCQAGSPPRPTVAMPVAPYPASLKQTLTEAERRLLEEAFEHFQSQDWEKAGRAYDAIVKQNPKISFAWFRLGYCLHIQGKFDEAIAAAEKAAEFPGLRPTAIYNQACAYALQGKKDRALERIEAAVASGFRDIAMLENDPDLAALRGDPRFKNVMAQARSAFKLERYQQLAFLEGKWHVDDPGGRRLGTSTIERSEGSYLLTEKWTSSGNYTGTNFFYFDPSDLTWRLTWVSSTGEIIRATGELKGKTCCLSGEHISPMDGKVSKYRGAFTPQDNGKIKLTQELSTDGKQWRIYFEGIYTRSDTAKAR